MKIVLIGCHGQLAHDLIRTLKDDELFLYDIEHIDVRDRGHFVGLVQGIQPDVVINTAAYHKVDNCEDEQEPTFDVNCMAAINGAIAAKKVGAKYVFYSTDYVYGADETRTKPYKEDEAPGPLSVYGWSKFAGEIGVRNSWEKHFVIRSCGLYGVKVSGKGYNFPGLMMKLGRERDEVKVVNDQRMTPTCTLDLAQKTAELIKTDKYGLYHLTNTGDCTWYEFTKAIFELTGIKTKLTPVTSEEFPTKAKRPPYSVLDNAALIAAGIEDMRHWKEALKDYLKEMGEIS